MIKNISAVIFFWLLVVLQLQAQYISGTTEQVSAVLINPGSSDNPIIRIRIETGPNPTDLYALFFTTNGSASPSTDVDSAKVYYTGNSTVFSNTVQYGNTVHPVSSGITVNSVFALPAGINYFWLTYDLNDSALACNPLDATCYTIYVSSAGTQTPAVTDPPGYGTVSPCAVGISESIIQDGKPSIMIFPNPAFETVNLFSESGIKKAEIINSEGKVVFEKFFGGSASGAYCVNLIGMKSGIYFVKVFSKQSGEIKKLFVISGGE